MKGSKGVCFEKPFSRDGVSMPGSKIGGNISSVKVSGGCQGAVLEDPGKGVPMGFCGSMGLPVVALFLGLAAINLKVKTRL
jgi:hypothetical protein